MRRIVLEIAVATLLTLGAVVSLAAAAMASDVMVMNAYARASATPAAKSGAVYLTIMNHGTEPDRLIGVSVGCCEDGPSPSDDRGEWRRLDARGR